MNNKVTVVIPVYNTEKYLKQCVASVTNQTCTNIEILIVDDGSTDGSAEICDELALQDSRIRVIHKKNGGAATARNLGIDESTGEYIMFLDSDDWLDTDAIETLVAHADYNRTDVVRFNYVREFNGKQLVKQNTLLDEKLYVDEECNKICRQILGLTRKEMAHPESLNFLASCGFNLYRRDLLVGLGVRFISIQEIGSFVDGLFNFIVFMNVRRFEFIDRPFYHYRKTNEGAVTAGYRKNYIDRQLVLFDKIKFVIESEQRWESLSEAYYNRIAFSTMEIAFNALRNKSSFADRYREICRALKHSTFKEAYKKLEIKYMGMKWRVYFFFIKHSMVIPTYMMTAVILKLKNRGTV